MITAVSSENEVSIENILAPQKELKALTQNFSVDLRYLLTEKRAHSEIYVRHLLGLHQNV